MMINADRYSTMRQVSSLFKFAVLQFAVRSFAFAFLFFSFSSTWRMDEREIYCTNRKVDVLSEGDPD